ncbi:ComGF family competence protein [Aureibacillus halotolerans]|uniref:Competence protein ComGF n=1 Tax=Aureibacillus halotolerans TaxID=1508390 RepID=A0A4R6UF01_9BACI|nr:ComGF family competence protein [Aureibacillus halotolerans]TDQ41674.1 competence protein ComGF [Aureibacillus halotolerans]
MNVVSVCYGLLIVTMSLSMLSWVLTTINTSPRSDLERLEYYRFIRQLKEEYHSAAEIDVVEATLILQTEDGRVTYEPYQDKYRRRVNGRGHDLVLQQVHQMSFSKENGGLKVVTTFESGHEVSSFLQNPFFYREQTQ